MPSQDTEPGRAPAPAGPAIDPDELVARAEAMIPELIKRQTETEERTYYAEDIHEMFKEAGFYRMLVPRRFGGLEVGVETFLRVITTIARGCPSTGWCLCLGSSHALQVGTFSDEQTQAELFGDGHFICPATVRPQGVAEHSDDGGWIINGTFNFCSGVPYATHYMGHVFEAGPEPADGSPRPFHLFVAPRSEWTQLDDWGDQLGLRGSGSHSIRFENGRIPARNLVPGLWFLHADVSNGAIGQQVTGNSMYGGSPWSFGMLEIAALAVGIASGARDAYKELMDTKTTLIPPIMLRKLDPTYQRWYGTGVAQVASAEAILMRCAHDWMEACRLGTSTRAEEVRLVSLLSETISMCFSAVERVFFRTAGSTAIRRGERIERAWRDISMVHSHTGVVFFAEHARAELGLLGFDGSAAPGG